MPLDFAHGANATQLVLGTSRRSRLARVFDEGIGARHREQLPAVYLVQLRRKLEPEPARPRHLITEPGMGYRFES